MLHITRHAVDRYIERIRPGADEREAKLVLRDAWGRCSLVEDVVRGKTRFWLVTQPDMVLVTQPDKLTAGGLVLRSVLTTTMFRNVPPKAAAENPPVEVKAVAPVVAPEAPETARARQLARVQRVVEKRATRRATAFAQATGTKRADMEAADARRAARRTQHEALMAQLQAEKVARTAARAAAAGAAATAAAEQRAARRAECEANFVRAQEAHRVYIATTTRCALCTEPTADRSQPWRRDDGAPVCELCSLALDLTILELDLMKLTTTEEIAA